MSILFEHVDIITGNGAEVLYNGHLLVEGDRVVAMGEGAWPQHGASQPGEACEGTHPQDPRPISSSSEGVTTRIDATGQVLMPAFYNAHTHVAMTLLRNFADDMDLQTWLFTRIFPTEARFDAAAVDAGTRLGLLEMLAGGTAGFIDMYSYCDATAQAVADAGMRMLLTRGLINGSEEGDFLQDVRLREAKEHFVRWHGAANGRIQTGLGPHAVYTCSPAYLRVIAQEAREMGVCVHVHVDETRREHEECLQKYGMTPTALCESVGLFEGRAIAAHCVHVSDQDLEILARNRVTIAHNPRSNLKLASGIAPVLRARAAGISVALGTDGASSNNTLDMWGEMGLAALIHKGASLDPLAITAQEAFQMATRTGAQAMGLTDAGFLAVGAKADLVMADPTGPHWQPRHNLISGLVYSGRSSDVRMTMVDGRILYRNGEFLTLDAERIHREVKQAMARVF